MTDLKKATLTKKKALKQITKTLERSLTDLRLALGEKTFSERVEKAAKILSKGLPKKKKESKKDSTKKLVKSLESPENRTDSAEGTIGS